MRPPQDTATAKDCLVLRRAVLRQRLTFFQTPRPFLNFSYELRETTVLQELSCIIFPSSCNSIFTFTLFLSSELSSVKTSVRSMSGDSFVDKVRSLPPSITLHVASKFFILFLLGKAPAFPACVLCFPRLVWFCAGRLPLWARAYAPATRTHTLGKQRNALRPTQGLYNTGSTTYYPVIA